MDFATLGFVRGNTQRLRILEALKSEAKAEVVSSRLRINLALVERNLKELEKHKLVKAGKSGYLITEQGLKILEQIKQHG